MLEDIFGWVIVLIGATIMKFTDFALIDPIMSICVSVFILVNVVKNLKEIINIFLEKAPDNINVEEIKEHLKNIDNVIDVHHVHIWSMDGQNNYATMHVVTNADNHEIKEKIRNELSEHKISHATLELEKEGEHCHEKTCEVRFAADNCHQHHH